MHTHIIEGGLNVRDNTFWDFFHRFANLESGLISISLLNVILRAYIFETKVNEVIYSWVRIFHILMYYSLYQYTEKPLIL